jgi:hypothetical protein
VRTLYHGTDNEQLDVTLTSADPLQPFTDATAVALSFDHLNGPWKTATWVGPEGPVRVARVADVDDSWLPAGTCAVTLYARVGGVVKGVGTVLVR